MTDLERTQLDNIIDTMLALVDEYVAEGINSSHIVLIGMGASLEKGKLFVPKKPTGYENRVLRPPHILEYCHRYSLLFGTGSFKSPQLHDGEAGKPLRIGVTPDPQDLAQFLELNLLQHSVMWSQNPKGRYLQRYPNIVASALLFELEFGYLPMLGARSEFIKALGTLPVPDTQSALLLARGNPTKKPLEDDTKFRTRKRTHDNQLLKLKQ